MDPNPHLLPLNRAPEDMRGRERFVRLDRNERVWPFAAEEFADMIGTIGPGLFCSYPDPSPLIERLAGELAVPSSWVYPTNGSDAAIRKVFQTFLRPGDGVVLADPTYAMYPIYTQMFAGCATLVPYRDDRTLDMDAFEAALAPETRILAIACPDQPTGAVLPLDDLRRLARSAAERCALCLIDEAYYPFHPTTAVGLIHELENVVVTRTFSKAGGLAGLRLGYLIARPEVLAHIERVRGAHEVNAAAIQIACYILDHPDISAAYVRDIEAGRDVLTRAAIALGLGVPACPANFQLLELPPEAEPQRIVNALKDRGFLIKGGFPHRSVAGCIRVTLAGPELMATFSGALSDVLRAGDERT